jgi:hypothetical protein
MKKYFLICLAFIAASTCLAALLFVSLPEASRVTEENCDRITKGMSKPEVEAVFGETEVSAQMLGEIVEGHRKTYEISQDRVASMRYDYFKAFQELLEIDQGESLSFWIAGDGCAHVRFDRNGNVLGAWWFSLPQESSWDTVLHFFHLK